MYCLICLALSSLYFCALMAKHLTEFKSSFVPNQVCTFYHFRPTSVQKKKIVFYSQFSRFIIIPSNRPACFFQVNCIKRTFRILSIGLFPLLKRTSKKRIDCDWKEVQIQISISKLVFFYYCTFVIERLFCVIK